MTRQDYERLAGTLRELPADLFRHEIMGREEMAAHVAMTLAADNDRFQPETFMRAVMGDFYYPCTIARVQRRRGIAYEHDCGRDYCCARTEAG